MSAAGAVSVRLVVGGGGAVRSAAGGTLRPVPSHDRHAVRGIVRSAGKLGSLPVPAQIAQRVGCSSSRRSLYILTSFVVRADAGQHGQFELQNLGVVHPVAPFRMIAPPGDRAGPVLPPM